LQTNQKDNLLSQRGMFCSSFRRRPESSFNMTREALNFDFVCFAQRISLDPGFRRDDEQNVGIYQDANPTRMFMHGDVGFAPNLRELPENFTRRHCAFG
jgi:hypothetical protein